MEKSFHSYTELPGKCLSVRLVERRKSSRKKTSNFYLESKIKPFTHSSSYASPRGQPFWVLSRTIRGQFRAFLRGELAHPPWHFRPQIESSPRHMLLAEAMARVKALCRVVQRMDSVTQPLNNRGLETVKNRKNFGQIRMCAKIKPSKIFKLPKYLQYSNINLYFKFSFIYMKWILVWDTYWAISCFGPLMIEVFPEQRGRRHVASSHMHLIEMSPTNYKWKLNGESNLIT